MLYLGHIRTQGRIKVMYCWTKYKEKQQKEGKQIDSRIRRKFYRAMDMIKKMPSKYPNRVSIDYIDGFCDGACLDAETREFIKFIIG